MTVSVRVSVRVRLRLRLRLRVRARIPQWIGDLPEWFRHRQQTAFAHTRTLAHRD